jgi:23S rRNA (cytosine1962-C5)-methyltransferase
MKSENKKNRNKMIFLQEISKNFEESLEFKRLFFGRSGAFKGYEFINVDNIENVIYAEIYKKDEKEETVIKTLEDFCRLHNRSLLIKKRYSNELIGEKIPHFAIENDVKFILDFSKQNIGYFGDIKPAREYVKEISKNKNVLNLFSYTCGFSMYARLGGARKIVNVDINKGVLKTGLKNHQINSIPTNDISFLSYDVLSAFGRLQRKIKADIVIIDPPSMQSSFNIFKHYEKIVSKLPFILNKNATIIATANHPEFSKETLKSLFKEYNLIKEIPPSGEYKNSSLKVLVFSA